MNSYMFSQTLTELIQILDESSLNPKLGEIASLFSSIEEPVNRILDALSSENSISAQLASVTKELNNSVSRLNDMEGRKIFADLYRFENRLNSVQKKFLPPAVAPFDHLNTEMEEFSKRLEAFLRRPYYPEAHGLVISARSLLSSLLSLRYQLSVIREAIEPEGDVDERHDIISLVLTSTLQYRDVVNKMRALDIIYAEMCQMMNVSPTVYPLKVIKIESGSLWLKLFGESRIIKLLISSIESALTFLYRNYTNEGKLSSIPKKVESIEAIIGLSQKLEGYGIDSSAIKDNLQKSAIVISSQLNDLLLGEPSVKINGVTHSIQQALQDKFLAESHRLMLKEGTNQENPQSD